MVEDAGTFQFSTFLQPPNNDTRLKTPLAGPAPINTWEGGTPYGRLP